MKNRLILLEYRKKKEGGRYRCWSRDKLCSGSTIWTNVVHLSIPLSARASFFIHLRGNTASSDLSSSLPTNCFTLACQTRSGSSRECEFLGWNLERNEHSPTELIGLVSPSVSLRSVVSLGISRISRGRSNFLEEEKRKKERKGEKKGRDCIDNKKGVNWFRRKNI